MKCTRLLLSLLLCVCSYNASWAQYPAYFKYDDNVGLPTNQIYNLVQDPNGLIWLGCEAGLFKFDGVKYTEFASASQKQKPLAGLTISASGTLYACNFQKQIFAIYNDSLRILPNAELPFINALAATPDGNLWVSHFTGLSVFKEASRQWEHHNQLRINTSGKQVNSKLVKLARLHPRYGLFFISDFGLGIIRNNRPELLVPFDWQGISPAQFVLEWWNDELWLFTKEEGYVWVYKNGVIKPMQTPNLQAALTYRKINQARALPDGRLWICTYTGIVLFDRNSGAVEVMYPEYAFSDCLLDEEGNYWLSTLHTGMLRVVNVHAHVWNKENNALPNELITKLATDGNYMYWASSNGYVGSIGLNDGHVNVYNLPERADVQSFEYDSFFKRVVFYVNSNLYTLKNGTVTVQPSPVVPVKASVNAGTELIFATSHGLVESRHSKLRFLTDGWMRDIALDATTGSMWVASNAGLLQFKKTAGEWQLTDTVLPETQIQTIDWDVKRRIVYGVTFNGHVFGFDSQKHHLFRLGVLPVSVQPHAVQSNGSVLAIGTNKGLWLYTLHHDGVSQVRVLSTTDGLASQTILDVKWVNNAIWMATGKGVQVYPYAEHRLPRRAKVYARSVYVQNVHVDAQSELRFNYGQVLQICPEASVYSSNGKFQYAYRIEGLQESWSYLPANITCIRMPLVPPGPFTIAVKVVDHLGRDSANVLYFKGYVNPPFWQSGLFYTLLVVVVVFVSFLVVKLITRNIRRKSQLATELSASKLKAIQAQMNPHFIFNSLNSILDLILKGDVEKSYTFITDYSDLIRRTLHYSDKDFIDFEQELELLRLYLSLEQLRFKDGFSYTLDDGGIDDIKIPPLLIQPFVENAISHGLLHKEIGEKKLHIQFSLGATLVCTITDNGIGREQARLMRERQRQQHESFSSKATQRRFELLTKTQHGNFGYTYTDLVDEKGMATGTQVTLHIPFRTAF